MSNLTKIVFLTATEGLALDHVDFVSRLFESNDFFDRIRYSPHFVRFALKDGRAIEFIGQCLDPFDTDEKIKSLGQWFKDRNGDVLFVIDYYGKDRKTPIGPRVESILRQYGETMFAVDVDLPMPIEENRFVFARRPAYIDGDGVYRLDRTQKRITGDLKRKNSKLFVVDLLGSETQAERYFGEVMLFECLSNERK